MKLRNSDNDVDQTGSDENNNNNNINERQAKDAVARSSKKFTKQEVNFAESETGKAGVAMNDADEQEVVKLVDSKDNQFVLAKGSDSTIPHEDQTLIKVRYFILNLILPKIYLFAFCFLKTNN